MNELAADAIDVIALARRIESLTQRGHWVSIGSLESHRKIQLSRSDLDDLRAAATELRRMETLVKAVGDEDDLAVLQDARLLVDDSGGGDDLAAVCRRIAAACLESEQA